MGLDNFAVQNKPNAEGQHDPLPDELFEAVHLCGGMFTGGSGSSGIRGKVYYQLVEEVTGVSLYDDLIPNEKVKEMAKSFTSYCAEQPDCTHQKQDWDCRACERTHLKRWLQIVAENDGAIVSWW